MHVKILINISDTTKLWFDSLLLKKMKSTDTKEVFFDFDNQSDKEIIGYAMRLVEESESTTVIFYVEDGFLGQLPTIFPFINKIRRSRSKVTVYQLGESDWLESQLNKLKIDSYLKFKNQQSLFAILSDK